MSTHENGKPLGVLADGTPVHARTDEDHLLAHPTALPFLPRAFTLIEGGLALGEAAAYELDLGRVIGVQTCVETGPDDDILFARRRGRTKGWTRFVRGREGSPCRTFVVRLVVHEPGVATLQTAYIGTIAPPEPWNPLLSESASAWRKARAFWAAHALLWDGKVEPEPVPSRSMPAYWGTDPGMAGQAPAR